MKRLTTDTPDGNFETVLNFVYGKDGWAYIRHDGEHEDVLLTDWAKRQCKFQGCDEALTETPEEIDQRLCDCMMDVPICPIALAYCFASQAVHLRSRLKMYEDTIPLERAQGLAQAEKDGRLVVLPCRVKDTVYITEAVYDRKRFSGERVVSAQIDHVTIGGTTGMPVFDLCTETGGWYYSMEPNQFYLTREEAEATLKKREED